MVVSFDIGCVYRSHASHQPQSFLEVGNNSIWFQRDNYLLGV